MRFTSRSTGIFVWMTDKFMSGWGQARGKINKLIIRCDTLEQAECIFKNAQMRDEMKNVNYGRKLPYFSENKYKLSFKTWDQLGYVWKTGCKWQNEDDYNDDPGRMRYTMEGLRGNPMSYHVGGLSSLGAIGERRRKLKIGKQEQALLNFAEKYPGWHGFNPRKHTANVVRRLAKKGLIELSSISNQFRELRKNSQMRSSFDKPVFGPGRTEYKRIDTTTGAGMRLEQKMRRAGWYQAQVTPFSTVLYRKKRR